MMRQLALAEDLTVFSLSADEARFVYREVFTERCYLQHGIALRDGDCVFDVGANIGLATVFFHQQAKNIRVFAFEPGPEASQCLKANIELHGVNARVFECGLSRESGVAEFTFYPGNTVMSGFHADPERDRQTTRTYMVNSGIAQKAADRYSGLLFKKTTQMLPLRRLSEIVDEEGVERIDLLKIDVERSEKDVLEGIRPEHWPRIRQVVMEVYDDAGGLAEVRQLLTGNGFQVAVDQDPLLRGTTVYEVYAVRPTANYEVPVSG
jgi:31-O-methyltransferase